MSIPISIASLFFQETVTATTSDLDSMVANIMSDLLVENKENIELLNCPQTEESSENIMHSETLQNLTNQISENFINDPTATVDFLATASQIYDRLSALASIAPEPVQNTPEPVQNATEPVQNLVACNSVIDLTPDTQHDSDISIVNSPVMSKRQKPVIVDLTDDSQPVFDTPSSSPSIPSRSRVSRKRKQSSILGYVVKTPKFTTMFPMKKELVSRHEVLNIPCKREKFDENRMADYYVEPETPPMINAIDEEFNIFHSPAAMEEDRGTSPMEEEVIDEEVEAENSGDERNESLIEDPENAPLMDAIDEYQMAASPMAEEVDTDDVRNESLFEDPENSPLPEVIDESQLAASHLEEEDGSNESIEDPDNIPLPDVMDEDLDRYKSPIPVEEDLDAHAYGYNPYLSEATSSNTASLNEMENISKISFSENLDIDFDLFIQNWNTETLNKDLDENIIKIDNLPIVEESPGEIAADIEEQDNLLCSDNVEMENLSMPYWNTVYSEPYNYHLHDEVEPYSQTFQSKELNSLDTSESEVDAL